MLPRQSSLQRDVDLLSHLPPAAARPYLMVLDEFVQLIADIADAMPQNLPRHPVLLFIRLSSANRSIGSLPGLLACPLTGKHRRARRSLSMPLIIGLRNAGHAARKDGASSARPAKIYPRQMDGPGLVLGGLKNRFLPHLPVAAPPWHRFAAKCDH
ncbi:hypothetical protein BKA80DRAFT_284471 [Phyllosticta citrichinensis]